MRLPLAIPLDARTGSATKDARLTNTVVENYQGRQTVAKRPALDQISTTTGTASGAVCFGGTLVTIYGTVLSKTSAFTDPKTVVAGQYDFAQSMV